MKLFEYAVIKNEKKDKDGGVVEEAAIVVPITAVLARNDEQANLIAARAIPEAEMDNLDRLTVVVRPFDLTGQMKKVFEAAQEGVGPWAGAGIASPTVLWAPATSSATYTSANSLVGNVNVTSG